MDPTFFTEREGYTDRTQEILQDYVQNIRKKYIYVYITLG